MRSRFVVGSALLLAACLARDAWAKETPQQTRGRQRYVALCASCHGTEGAGDGPAAAWMKEPPPDLRRIAERNGGRFDPRTVAATIDGRSMAGAHGSEDMPVWGWKRLRARKGDVGPSPGMLDLLAYLESIQVKPKP